MHAAEGSQLAKHGATMTKGRMEAFSDGVITIVTTIMMLELAVPYEPS